MTESVKRGTLRLLLDPTFGGLFVGKLVSVAGVWVHSVVAAVVIFEATHSTTAVALASLAQYGPQIVLAPLSGALTDRGHVRSQLIVGRLLCTIGSGFLAVWVALVGVHHGWATAVAILATSLVVGLGFVVGGPAQQSVVPQLVTPAELPTAMVLNTAPTIVGRNVGPVLGAAVLATSGSATAFAAAAASHLVFTGILATIKLPRPMLSSEGEGPQFRHALRHVRDNRPLLLLLVASTASAVGSEPTITLTPAMAAGHGGAHAVTVLSLAFAVGSTTGFATTALVARHTSQAATSSAGLVLMTAGSCLAALADPLPAALLAFAFIGGGFGWTMTASMTLIQQDTPGHLRGRVMAMWLIGFVGARPLAAALVGALADLGSVSLAFGALTAVLVAATLVCTPARVQTRSTEASVP